MARFLIVEDERDIRQLSRNLLELLGHHVDEASSGERAVMLLRMRRYDVVLSDLGLPGMDGWAVARAVKQFSPRTKVGLVSGWDVSPKSDRLKARGVDFLLPKPFDLDTVEATLARLTL